MPELPELPPIASQPISVLLLAHNDEAHLRAILDDWHSVLSGLGRDHELILADEGSTDKTSTVAREWAASHPELKLVRSDQAVGLGAAIKRGLAAARFPLVALATADHQYRPADFPALLREIDKVHLVSGFRRWQPVPWGLRVLGWVRRFLMRIIFDVATHPLPGWLGWRDHLDRLLIRILFGVRVQDVRCAFCLCRRTIFERIPIQSRGSFVLAEILAKANFLGHLLAEEVPIVYRPRPAEGFAALERGRRQWWQDGYRVFAAPSFGPVRIV
jgi:glycosyltransferase involved in cell wall biosynthesis